SGIIGFLMRGAGQIPVDRRTGRAALQTGLALLNEERLVGGFPEGTRGRGDPKETKGGIASVAVRAQATVLPAAMLGPRPAGKKAGHVPPPGARLTVVFGEPFEAAVPEAGIGRRAVAGAMGTIQQRLSDHVLGSAAKYGIALPESTEI